MAIDKLQPFPMTSIDGTSLIRDVLREGGNNIFVLSLGFEDRCLTVARALVEANLSRKQKILCIEHGDENVTPFAVSKRSALKIEIERMLSPEWCSRANALTAVEHAARHANDPSGPSGIAIDASTMPRELVLRLLATVASERPGFQNVFLFYSQPEDYVSGDFEVPSPHVVCLPPVSASLRLDNLTVVIFPGFSANDSAVLLASVLDPNHTDQRVRIRWVFCHPGAHHDFYERALEGHRAFLRQPLEKTQQDHKLCRMDDVNDVASRVIEVACEMEDAGALFIGVSGPRILLGPVFLTVSALRKHGIEASVLVTRPLVYRSVRSIGESGITHAWNLEEAYAGVVELVSRSQEEKNS